MFRLSAGLVGTFVLAFLLTAVVDNALGRNAGPASVEVPAMSMARAPKGDALGSARPAGPASTVATVELVGVSGTTIILRDRGGSVLFRSDPVTNTTVVARDVDLPVVTVKERSDSPVAPLPPSPAKPRRPAMAGCDGLVSALVDSDANRLPGLCLADGGAGFRA